MTKHCNPLPRLGNHLVEFRNCTTIAKTPFCGVSQIVLNYFLDLFQICFTRKRKDRETTSKVRRYSPWCLTF
uniref:Uncharacterized protein n=1 Tax=Pararge aegeria TaxID=116150 RepID=S4PR32_9NEOP